eukprot:3910536-Pyramimonas_sp.AAC.1
MEEAQAAIGSWLSNPSPDVIARFHPDARPYSFSYVSGVLGEHVQSRRRSHSICVRSSFPSATGPTSSARVFVLPGLSGVMIIVVHGWWL